MARRSIHWQEPEPHLLHLPDPPGLPHLFPEVKKVDAGSKSVGACEAREIISFVSGQKQLECGGGTGLE